MAGLFAELGSIAEACEEALELQPPTTMAGAAQRIRHMHSLIGQLAAALLDCPNLGYALAAAAPEASFAADIEGLKDEILQLNSKIERIATMASAQKGEPDVSSFSQTPVLASRCKRLVEDMRDCAANLSMYAASKLDANMSDMQARAQVQQRKFWVQGVALNLERIHGAAVAEQYVNRMAGFCSSNDYIKGDKHFWLLDGTILKEVRDTVKAIEEAAAAAINLQLNAPTGQQQASSQATGWQQRGSRGQQGRGQQGRGYARSGGSFSGGGKHARTGSYQGGYQGPHEN